MDVPPAVADFARGVLAGLVVCVPPGPMSTLCVSRSVRHGFVHGFATAAGAAIGDAAYAAVAACGLASLTGRLGAAPRVAALIAAPLLLWTGLRFISRARALVAANRLAGRSGAAPPTGDTGPPPLPLPAAGAGFAMALGTPGTLPAFIALFATLSPGGPSLAASAGSVASAGFVATVTTTAGVLAATLLWWAGVAALACRFRESVSHRLHVIEAAGGILLVVASLAAVRFAILGGMQVAE